jgi:hypothetical protein
MAHKVKTQKLSSSRLHEDEHDGDVEVLELKDIEEVASEDFRGWIVHESCRAAGVRLRVNREGKKNGATTEI